MQLDRHNDRGALSGPISAELRDLRGLQDSEGARLAHIRAVQQFIGNDLEVQF